MRDEQQQDLRMPGWRSGEGGRKLQLRVLLALLQQHVQICQESSRQEVSSQSQSRGLFQTNLFQTNLFQ